MPDFAWVDLGGGRQVYCRVAQPMRQRSSLPAPMLNLDTMPETQHPCTGEFFTSKSEFRKVTLAHGMVELGNDPARLRKASKAKPDRKRIKDAVEKAKARFDRGERADNRPRPL
jgi:hypothetical protein